MYQISSESPECYRRYCKKTFWYLFIWTQCIETTDVSSQTDASAVHTAAPVVGCARGGEGGGHVDLVISSGLSGYALT